MTAARITALNLTIGLCLLLGCADKGAPQDAKASVAPGAEPAESPQAANDPVDTPSPVQAPRPDGVILTEAVDMAFESELPQGPQSPSAEAERETDAAEQAEHTLRNTVLAELDRSERATDEWASGLSHASDWPTQLMWMWSVSQADGRLPFDLNRPDVESSDAAADFELSSPKQQ